MRKSDCVLIDGHSTNSFNQESGRCVKTKKKNKTPLKNSAYQDDIFLKSENQNFDKDDGLNNKRTFSQLLEA